MVADSLRIVAAESAVGRFGSPFLLELFFRANFGAVAHDSELGVN